MTAARLSSYAGVIPAPLGSLRLSPDAATGAPPITDPPKAPSSGDGGRGTGAPTAEQVSLTRAEYDKISAAAKERDALAAERDALRTDWTHAERLLKPTDNPQETADSVRHVMKKAGYTPAQIEAYVDAMTGKKPAEDGRGTQRPGGRKPAAESDGEGDPDAPSETAVLTQRLDTTEKQLAELERRRLESLLGTSVTTHLDTNKDLGTLIEAFVRADPETLEDPAKQAERRRAVRSTFSEEINRQIRDGLRQRHAQTRGGWDDGWVVEEAMKAAKAVYGKYRGLVGDPSRLGRAPETDYDGDRFVNLKPVPPPQVKKGATIDSVSTDVRSWALDRLSREAHSLSNDGKSMV